MAQTRRVFPNPRSNPPLPPGGTIPCDLPPFLSDNPDLERLYDNVMAQMPDVTVDMVSLVAWNTIEDFYQQSTLRREHIFWRMEPGVSALNFDPWPPGDWRVCRFLSFRGPDNYKFEPPGRIRDLNTPVPPTAERSGEILLALKPSSIATQLPYDVWTQWFECLQAGMMYRLYLQPGKPYSNLQGAQLHGHMYKSGIASARALVQANNIRDGSSWSYPYFSSGHLKNA